MIEEPKAPRIEGDELIIETTSGTEVYDAKYMTAVLLVFVAKGNGSISNTETDQMLALLGSYYELSSSESLGLLRNAIRDLAENPDMKGLLGELSSLVSEQEKEDIVLMLLKVVAANGRKDAEEMEKLREAANMVNVPADVMHRAYDRYFEETNIP